MSKVSADHLSRQAFVYVRQSTPDQLKHNHESRRRQYGLTVRARNLGRGEPVVINEDLRQTARRGELVLNVAVGYVKVRRDRIVKDPDRRVQEIATVT